MNERELHVVLGAGQVGPRVAQLLLDAGHRVRVVRQSAAPPRVAGVEAVVADVRDSDAVQRATEGAAVVYSCVNPPYDRWGELLLPMTRGIVSGVARSRARLVALDNLYMYGDTARMHEDSPLSPRSRKGRLRAEAGQLLLDAGAAVGRAADFFGPETPLSILGEHFFSRVHAGKSAQLFGDPDQPHSYSFTPDVARGLVALGSAKASGLTMLPVQPAESTRALVARFGSDIAITTVPTWVLRLAGLFDRTMGELAEMTYQWEQPFVLDDAKIRRELGLEPTPWDEAVAETLAWAERRWPVRGSSRRLRSAAASSPAR